MSECSTVITDFGGVLTSPLREAFEVVFARSGVPYDSFVNAMRALTVRDGVNPMHELETGRITEEQFLGALSGQLSADAGREVSLNGFATTWFGALRVNEPVLARMHELRERGYRMALLTNNVREWSPLWRAMFAVEDVFDVVVDSAFVGMRKPEPEIYELTLERLGARAQETLFIDDVSANCRAAVALGMRAVHFETNEQALAEIAEALGDASVPENAG
jgi:putative hydrolase of the HAD superfamily